jgi:hypothetical protein
MSATYLRAIARSGIALIVALSFKTSIATAGQSGAPSQAIPLRPPFALVITADSVVALGAPFELRVRLTNSSSHEMNGSTGNVNGFNGAYTYDIRDQSGNALRQKAFDPTLQGSGRIIVLKPGQSRDDSTNLSEAYNLRPGKHTIQLSMPVSNDPGAEVVKSNKIIVTVTRWLLSSTGGGISSLLP